MSVRKSVLVVWIAFLSCLCHAHDFWIEPSTFAPAVGSTVSVRLMVGVHFLGEPAPRMSSWIEQFVLSANGENVPIAGKEWSDPAGYCRIQYPGTQIVSFQSGFSAVELEARLFEDYLKEEGLEHIIELRKQKNETDNRAVEWFSRSAKSYLRAGAIDSTGYDKPFDLTLEIVPKQNPAAMQPQVDLPIQLLFRGNPIQHVLVKTVCKDSSNAPSSTVRTDSKGEAILHFSTRGIWMIKAVHMVPAREFSGADYESYWSSLTFQIP